MRVPISVAWLLLAMAFFTSGLLRQFHDQTPRSPYVPTALGSLLFLGIVFLLLVAAREFRRGAVPGPGVRLGSLTPLLLMLFIEKWISLALYNPIFYFLVSDRVTDPDALDAYFRAFAGGGLLLVCLLVARFSAPTARKTWRRARPARWPAAAIGAGTAIGGSYLVLALVIATKGGFSHGTRLVLPQATSLLWWILCGQALLAFAEEVYYRGLLMSETERLVPRLGARSAPARRWLALGLTSLLFGLEHISINPPWDQAGRQLIFTISMALLFGLLVMVSANLHFAAGIHAWINWMQLGAAPRFVDAAGQPTVQPGAYIGLALALAFVLAFALQRLRHRGSPRA